MKKYNELEKEEEQDVKEELEKAQKLCIVGDSECEACE